MMGAVSAREALWSIILLQRSDIVGHRLANILGDSSLSDESINYCDFVYQTDNGHCFRMPYDRDTADLLPHVEPTPNHSPTVWPRKEWWHYRRKLWTASITDILVPADPEERFLDTGIIALSSGWFVAQCGGTPIGILPSVNVIEEISAEPMISVWAT
jgi:hypothetical protein